MCISGDLTAQIDLANFPHAKGYSASREAFMLLLFYDKNEILSAHATTRLLSLFCLQGSSSQIVAGAAHWTKSSDLQYI